MTFRAGEFYKNKQKWQQAIHETKETGGFVPRFLEEAVDRGGVNVRHRDFTNNNAKNVIFRGHNFGSHKALMQKEFRNSSSISKNIEEVGMEIQLLLDSGAIEEVSEEEAKSPGSLVSPILWITQMKPDGTKKCRLIHHDMWNYQYSRPKFTLTDIAAELDILAEFLEIEKHDLEKAFYQVSVTPESSKTLRFKIRLHGRTKFYQWKVLCMGISSAPFIVQSSGWLLTETFGRNFKVYISLFIDDFCLEVDNGDNRPNFVAWASTFGLRFKISKSERGSSITILGVLLDLIKKTAQITPDKAAAIAGDGALMLESGKASPKQLATFYGRVEFAARVSSLGRSHTLELTKMMGRTDMNTNELSDSQTLTLDEAAKDDIRFWVGVKDHQKLQIGARKHRNAKLLSSDSSGSRWAFTVGDKSVASDFPADMRNDHINVKEAYWVVTLT